MNKSIFILGMHRSGTSAIIGILNILGIEIGSDLLPAQKDNPKGFFENKRVVDINDKIFKSMNSSWESLFALPENWWKQESILNTYSEEIINIVKTEFINTDIFAIKDPRLCKLFPLWKKIFNELGIETYCVIPLRHPLEVAFSLEKRNNFSIEKSLLLWISYILDAEKHTRNIPRLFITFNTLLKDPGKFINNFSEITQIVFSHKCKEKIEQFIDVTLKHHNVNTSKINNKMHSSLLELYDLLSFFENKNTISRNDLQKIDTIRSKHQSLINFFYNSDIRSKDTHILNLEHNANEKDTHINNLDDIINAKDAQIEGSESALRDTRRLIILQDAKIADLKSQTSMISKEKDTHIYNLEKLSKEKDTHIYNLEKLSKEKDTHINNLDHIANEKDTHINNLDHIINAKDAHLNHIYNSHGWKFLLKYYKVRDVIAPQQSIRKQLILRVIHFLKGTHYEPGKDTSTKSIGDAIMAGTRTLLSKEELNIQRKAEFKLKPKISIVVPTYKTPKHFLVDMIESVLDQTYSNWELCIADGTDKQRNKIKKTLKAYQNKDSRIKVKFLDNNMGIAGNSNEALSLATGDYIALLDHDDMLPPFSLFEVVTYINNNHGADFLYSDEDKIPEDNTKRYDAFFKPDYSPDMLLSYNYICHFTVIRKDLMDRVGGFREGFDGSQDYDLFLRTTRIAKNIIHIPKILYHWRAHQGSTALSEDVKDYAIVSAKKAIADYLSQCDYKTEIYDGSLLSTYHISYEIKNNPEVSIIIPTKDNVKILRTCITSILDKTDYQNYKIIIADNASTKTSTIKYFEEIVANPRISVINYNKPFNFSAINNYAVSQTDSEYLLFLNNDTSVINSDWLTSMLEHAQRKEIGAVGAKLYYPDNKIQHAGVILGLGGVAGHSHKFSDKNACGYFGRLKVIQNLSAVTAACLMIRKEVFEEVGGLDEGYSHAFNDVDLCIKIREKNYLIVWTPYAELYHYESKSRGYEDTPEKQERFRKEMERFKSKWQHIIDRGDPYYNPNLTLDKEDFSLSP